MVLSRFKYLFLLGLIFWAPLWAQNGAILERAVELFIRDRVDTDSLVLDINLPSVMPVQPIEEVAVDYGKPAATLRGQLTLTTRVLLSGGYEQTLYVRTGIRTFDKIVIALKNLHRHKTIGAADVAVDWYETTRITHPFFRGVHEVEGLRTRRYVMGDRPVLEPSLETQPIVRRGQGVDVSLVRSNLSITARGIARDDGWKGDVIRVRIPDNNREVKARVENELSVIVIR